MHVDESCIEIVDMVGRRWRQRPYADGHAAQFGESAPSIRCGLRRASPLYWESSGSQPMACSLKLQRRPAPQVCSCLPWQYWVCARSGRRGTGVVSGSRGDDKLVTSSQQPMH